MNDDENIAVKVKLAMLRNRHNTLADIEKFCTGTAKKLKQYAPLLRHIADWKGAIQINMKRLESQSEGPRQP